VAAERKRRRQGLHKPPASAWTQTSPTPYLPWLPRSPQSLRSTATDQNSTPPAQRPVVARPGRRGLKATEPILPAGSASLAAPTGALPLPPGRLACPGPAKAARAGPPPPVSPVSPWGCSMRGAARRRSAFGECGALSSGRPSRPWQGVTARPGLISPSNWTPAFPWWRWVEIFASRLVSRGLPREGERCKGEAGGAEIESIPMLWFARMGIFCS
jgi:hypothetical protein